MNNIEKAVAKVEAKIKAGSILRAYNALDHEETTVGSYTEAVDRGYRFAVISQKSSREYRSAQEAAFAFVSRVGSTRANEVARV